MKKTILCSLIISFFAFSSASFGEFDSNAVPLESSSNVIQADVKTERIPAGTTFEIRMETPVNSFNYSEGDSFGSTLLDDVRVGSLIVLPAGTLLRGTVGSVKPASRFCTGGELGLNFDHAVTPFGKQIPLSVRTTRAKNLTEEGTFAAGGSYTKELGKNFDRGAEILGTTFDYLTEWGKSFWKGIPVIATAPAGAFVGTVGGAGYFVAKSTYDMFRKGEEIKVNPGDIIEVTLIEPLDVPTN